MAARETAPIFTAVAIIKQSFDEWYYFLRQAQKKFRS